MNNYSEEVLNQLVNNPPTPEEFWEEYRNDLAELELYKVLGYIKD